MRTNHFFSLIAAALVPGALAACSGATTSVGTEGQSEEPSSAATSAAATPLTGVEMFRGLIVGQGRGASLRGPTAFPGLGEGQSVAELRASFAEVRRVASTRGASAEELQKLDDFAAKIETGEVTPESWVTRITDATDEMVASITATHPAFFDELRAAMTSGDRVRIKDALAEAGRLAHESLPTESAAVKGSGSAGLALVTAHAIFLVNQIVTSIATVIVYGEPGSPDLQQDVMVDRLATDLAGK